ncbi:DMT family transporter [Streptomonospora nanhaiensis]|uniref:Drug/metabolite transporter (DMT)-like permease n=2 Tax=Streptomonospora nanhaiensis TaxID=1323731 RepID=A0A853BMI9_9ACTN|nr:DMT family transporter [Streptomonospora nanhaiensis]MBX9386809.1 DMT family transporter [Streptomonospora nanhaiensis]NYI96220.1 drug/metabolite transporter (DMT)-like permease [Streptomonospora nanhaiensis]
MSGAWIAAAVALASAVCYGTGAATQRRLAARLGGPLDRRMVGVLMRQRLWWFAVALNGAGAALHVVVLAYGTLIVVQPLGTLALVFALPWAARWSGRRVSRREWWGALLTVAGLSVLLVAAASSGEGRPLGPSGALLTLGAVLLAVAAFAAAGRFARRPRWRSGLYAAAAGAAFAGGSAMTKALTDTATAQGVLAAVAHPAPAGIAALAAAGALLSQAAYRGSAVGAPLAVINLANPLSSVVVGLTFLGETYQGGVWGVVVAAAAGLVAMRGVFLLATVDPDTGEPAGRAGRGERAGAAGRATGDG